MEDRKSLESTVEESHGIKEATCTHSMVRNWRGLPLHGVSRKAGTYKPKGEIVNLAEKESEESIVPMTSRTT